MCTLAILWRPDHAWPVILGANRDEMFDRAWRAPGRHWPDRPRTVAGRDALAGGSWLGINDDGLVAAILNRRHSLGPAQGKRSRGELVMSALDHADLESAASALGAIDANAYRAFNLVLADRSGVVWLRNAPESAAGRIERFEVPAGVSLLAESDLNDADSPRIAKYLPAFRSAAPPDPAAGDWSGWTALLASRETAEDGWAGSAMTIDTGTGFGTSSSSLIALPATGGRPVWLFAKGAPDTTPFRPVAAIGGTTA